MRCVAGRSRREILELYAAYIDRADVETQVSMCMPVYTRMSVQLQYINQHKHGSLIIVPGSSP
jgi:hypothetical protein